MTKAELIKALEPYDDNTEVCFTMDGLASMFSVDEVKDHEIYGFYLYCIDSPGYDDIQELSAYMLDNESLPEDWMCALSEVADLPFPFLDLSDYQRD